METLHEVSLEDLLAFEDEDIISRFTDKFAMEDAEAREIMQETLKFLYISRIPGVFISGDLLILDEMWHNMILFTPQYFAFCQKYFNSYVHHLPASKQEKEERERAKATDQEKAREDFLKKLEVLMSVTYDHLGEDTVKKWFVEYPERYSQEKINAMRKK